MAKDLPEDLREIAELQRGVISRGQAQSAGLSQDVIAAQIHSRRWQRLYPGVYAAFTGSPSREAILWAALLRVGSGAILSHQTAAELDQLADRSAPCIHVTIPVSRRVAKIPGIVVHNRLDIERAKHPSRLPPRTRTEETVLDLASCANDVLDAIAWVTAALGRRLTTQELLRDALSRRSKFRWRTDIAQVLSPDLAGIHSALEFRYLRDVEQPHQLPKGRRQAPATRRGVSEYRDILYEAYAVAVELDGRAAHPGDTRWQDIRRDNAAAVRGIVTLRYGYRELTVMPCLVAGEVGDVLQARGWPGSPLPCSPTCPLGLRS